MQKVLFVCLGNICRSTMAEAVLRHMAEENGLGNELLVSSAGTAGYHIGSSPHQGTQKILDDNGISHAGIYASQLEESHIEEFDFIIAMDDSNMRDIKKITGKKEEPKLYLLSEFADSNSWTSVPDPYYTGNFEETYDLVTEGCRGILKKLFDIR